ncbi:outer membrane beta-barrel protein [Thalassospira sp. ER-Se-21-Dark]|uniref:outer membrane protein n=1 Tax=Thalassospira sp. ER-Se-21-Dark TaxID=2585190 RepID=UPI001B313979|nr:outer membrane beta-barrel protein [Thalassospira sp. ER-Se-21-Dark]MBP3125199.1 porin family protein [Thalassospira sp. ER-Se-21-Dark]
MISFLPTSELPQRFQRSSLIALFAALVMTAVSVPAQAEEWLLTPYLRADLGYSSTINDKVRFFDSAGTASFEMTSHKGTRYQIGAGLKLTDYLRTDITVSHGARLSAADDYRDPDGIADKPVNMMNDGALETSNWTTMMNVYVDPLSLAGIGSGAFSPYVQGGIGWARNKTEKMFFANNSFIIGDTHNDLAWQIGAGVGYAISDHWTLDLSYRFLDMGEARGGDTYISGATKTKLEAPRFDLRAHEFMVGLQYQF